MTKEMEQAFNFIDELEFSEGTKKNYKSALRKIVNYSKKNFYESINNQSAYNYIAYTMKSKKNNEYVINTNYNNIDALYGFLTKYKVIHPKLINTKNINNLKEIREDLSNKRRQNTYQQNIKTNTTIENLYNLFDSYDITSLEYLYLAFNLLMPPRRSEYIYCVFVKNFPKYPNKNINYVVMGEEYVRLVFYKYKEQVSDILGVWDRSLKNSEFSYLPFTDKFSRINPEKLGEIIKYHYNNNEYYCLNGDLETMEMRPLFPNDRNLFNTFIAKTLKKYNKTMKQTFIRNIVINEFLKVNTNAQIKKDFAYDCGQKSLETQLLYADYVADEEIEDKELFDEERINEEVNSISSCEDYSDYSTDEEDNIAIKPPIIQIKRENIVVKLEAAQAALKKYIEEFESKVKELDNKVLTHKNDLSNFDKLFEDYH